MAMTACRMKLLFFGILICIGCCMVSASQLEQVFKSHSDFTILLPRGWIEIPQAEIMRTIAELRSNYPDAPQEDYDYAYQLDSSGKWFDYPYIMIQVKNTGKLDEPSADVFKSIKPQLVRGLKQEFETATDNISETNTYNKDVSFADDLVDWDLENHVMWMGQRSQVADVGAVLTIMAVCLTEKGVLRVGLAIRESDYSTYLPLFREIVNSIEYDPSIQYKPASSAPNNSMAGVTPNEETLAFIERRNNNRYESKGHAKSEGINIIIDYPSSWTAKEGNRPHIVQNLSGRDNRGYLIQCLISVKRIPFHAWGNEDDLISMDNIKQLIAEMEQASFVDGDNTKIEGQKAVWGIFSQTGERAGLTLNTHNMMFMTVYKHKLIGLHFSMSSKDDKSILARQFALYRPLFHLIANSLILKDKWEDSR